jgi:hypothetical protein
MKRKKDLRQAQLALIALWVGGVLRASLMLLEDTLMRQSADAAHGWGWLLSATMPTIGLVLGAFTATPHAQQSGRSADMPFFHLTIGMSCFYLSVVNPSVFSMWFLGTYSSGTFGTISSVLGPIQGLLTAALGFFFIRLGNPERATDES